MKSNLWFITAILLTVAFWVVFIIGKRSGWFEAAPIVAPVINVADSDSADGTAGGPVAEVIPLAEALGVGVPQEKLTVNQC